MVHLNQFCLKNVHHFRILVFSKDPIERVTVAIDGLLLGNARHVKGPLFVLPWKPEDFAHGVHMINVDVKVTILIIDNLFYH